MPSQYGPKIVKDGLVLCLDAANRKSYPGTGTTWFDLSGRGNHVQLNNGVMFDSSKKCFVFDGTDDYGFNSGEDLKPSVVSLFAIIKHTNSLQSIAFIGGCGTTTYNGYWIGVSGNLYRFSSGTGSFYIEGVNASPQIVIKGRIATNIEHLGGTFDGSNIRVYDRGKLINTVPYFNSGNINYGTLNGFFLGNIEGLSSTRYWTGEIYSLFLYNRVLSDLEIAQNYNATKGRYGL